MRLPVDARLVALVALGGALGAVARYLVGAALVRDPFPYATLLVNVVGTFVLALLLFHELPRGNLDASARAFLGIGLLGAFTTMSTFSYETIALWLEGAPGRAALNVALNVGLSLGAIVLGRAVALATTAPSP